MASTQRKEQRQKELLKLGRTAKAIEVANECLRERLARAEVDLIRVKGELSISYKTNVKLEQTLSRAVQAAEDAAQQADLMMREYQTKLHTLSTELTIRTSELAEAKGKLVKLEGQDAKTLRRRLHDKSEQLKELQTELSRIKAERRQAEAF